MSYVYIIKNMERPNVYKIGFSGSPETRVAQLQTASPDRLKLIAKIPGTMVDEASAHRALADYRMSGEWFNCDDGYSRSLIDGVVDAALEIAALLPSWQIVNFRGFMAVPA